MIKSSNQVNLNKSNDIKKHASFICDVCKQSFNYKYILINHLRTHYSNFKIKQEIYQCKVCDIEYCKYSLLLKHIRKKHFNFEGKVSFFGDKMVNETWVERVNKSNVCVQMTKLTDNVITIKRCSPINCDINAKEAEDKMTDQITVHNSKIVNTKVFCNYCNKEMLSKSLRNHIKRFHLKNSPSVKLVGTTSPDDFSSQNMCTDRQ